MVQGFFGNIDNRDARIYRFIRLPYFRQLVNGELVLVIPTVWEDPYEILTQKSLVTDKRSSPWRQYPLASVLGNVFAQSWSLNEDSDTYLRAYSSVRRDSTGRNADPEFEGVRITTTPRKLQDAMEQALRSEAHSGEAFVFACGVKYVPGETIKSAVASSVHRNASTALERAQVTADLCLLKRLSFVHEHEVRFMVMFSGAEQAGSLLTLNIEPASFIDEVEFDPRLAKGERIERAELLKGSSLEGRVVERDQYQGLLLEIIVD